MFEIPGYPLFTIVKNFVLPKTAEEARRRSAELNAREREKREAADAAHRKDLAQIAAWTCRAHAASQPGTTPPGAPRTIARPPLWTSSSTLAGDVYRDRNQPGRQDAPAARDSSATLAGEVFKNRNGDGGAA